MYGYLRSASIYYFVFFFVIIYEQVENSYRVVIIWIYTFRAIKMNKQLKKKKLEKTEE